MRGGNNGVPSEKSVRVAKAGQSELLGIMQRTLAEPECDLIVRRLLWYTTTACTILHCDKIVARLCFLRGHGMPKARQSSHRFIGWLNVEVCGCVTQVLSFRATYNWEGWCLHKALNHHFGSGHGFAQSNGPFSSGPCSRSERPSKKNPVRLNTGITN